MAQGMAQRYNTAWPLKEHPLKAEGQECSPEHVPIHQPFHHFHRFSATLVHRQAGSTATVVRDVVRGPIPEAFRQPLYKQP